jgi:hypothetical protein
MYGIAKVGARGELLTLIGSQNSDSGGNSMAPAGLMDPANRPTKIDRRSDAVGLVDTGDVATVLSAPVTVKVLESMAAISKQKVEVATVSTGLPPADDAITKKRLRCAYMKTADTVEKFSSPAAVDPGQDPEITALFGANFGGDNEFQKTAAVMKLVIEGRAGAGTISMGGFDYHTGDRATGEMRDFRAGQCMGACLEFAANRGQPLMMYVFSDGSLSSNGAVDMSVNGRGKGQWTGDNQQTAAAFFLVYNPQGRPTLLEEGGIPTTRRQQLGYFRRDGDVETAGSAAANNVNLLVQAVVLNYMALHDPNPNLNKLNGNGFTQGLGDTTAQRSMIAFNPIVNKPFV